MYGRGAAPVLTVQVLRPDGGSRSDVPRRLSHPGVGAAARGCLRATGSPYSPFAPAAEELGHTGDPTLEPSPFFTSMHGYRTHHHDQNA